MICLERAKQWQKPCADDRVVTREEGEHMVLNTETVHPQQPHNPKLASPHEVLQKLGHVAQRLALPAETKVHPLHVSPLNPCYRIRSNPFSSGFSQWLPRYSRIPGHLIIARPTGQVEPETKMIEFLTRWEAFYSVHDSSELETCMHDPANWARLCCVMRTAHRRAKELHCEPLCCPVAQLGPCVVLVFWQEANDICTAHACD